ncbi:MAG: 30S ribosomal protein S12 methylthiotransferase RimO, partial [Chromatocurvus sp.]
NALPDPVADDIKQERWERFMATQQTISADRQAAKIGRWIEVLIDSVDERGATGRSRADAPEIDGLVHLEGVTDLQPGDIVEAQVTAADDYDLWAG